MSTPRFVGAVIAVVVFFVVVLAVLGGGVGEPELIIWFVLLGGTLTFITGASLRARQT